MLHRTFKSDWSGLKIGPLARRLCRRLQNTVTLPTPQTSTPIVENAGHSSISALHNSRDASFLPASKSLNRKLFAKTSEGAADVRYSNVGPLGNR
jgi:hypothetical protein